LRASVLRLNPRPRPSLLPNKAREIALVDDALKSVFRDLVSGKRDWPLFLYGPPGTGKTCAALALCDYLWDWQLRYRTASELASEVMATFGTGERFNWRPFARFKDDGKFSPDSPAGKSGAALVVLDELGARERVTDTHYESVQRLIDLRESEPLILVSNLNIAAIGKVYDARIASRCEAGTVVELAGKDRRVSA
jgi:DNA replication protein DnaC